MKKSLAIPLSVLAIWAWGNAMSQAQRSLQDTLVQQDVSEKWKFPKVIYDGIDVTSKQDSLIKSSVKWYFSHYHTHMRKLVISADTIEENNGLQTLAHANPKTIYLDPHSFEKNADLHNIIVHELFHTIKPDTLLLTTPYMLQDGYQIIWYHGLSIIVKKDAIQTKFGLFEDAAAEACASLYDKKYSVPNIYYANIWSLMLQMIHRGRITADDLIDHQSTNGVESFCGKILNKKVSPADVEFLMQIFNEVYMTTDDLTQQALVKIEQARNIK